MTKLLVLPRGHLVLADYIYARKALVSYPDRFKNGLGTRLALHVAMYMIINYILKYPA